MYDVTVHLATGLLSRRGSVRSKRLTDAAVRGGLLVDAALAGQLGGDVARPHVSVSRSGFTPADRLLSAVADDPSRSVGDWVLSGPVGMPELTVELLSRGWWQTTPRSLRHPRTRCAATPLITALPSAGAAGTLTEVLEALFDPRVDPDDLRERVMASSVGRATWLAPTVVDRLADLRLWLAAIAATPSGGG